MKTKKLYPEFWESTDNKKISCKEKILVLNQNLDELQSLINQIYDEAILMGVKKQQIEKIIKSLVNNLYSDLKNDK
jgi:hypothetical protein